ncbi:MAG: hypothetical protein PVF17_00915 [Ignavibacteria bacterium]
MKEHPDYFKKQMYIDTKIMRQKVLNWYMAEIEKEKNIDLLYHVADTDWSDADQIINEYKEIFEEV